MNMIASMYSDCVFLFFFACVDVNNLTKFVSVALITSAEGDYSNDKLARLKIVGNGYSPLIFDLQSNLTFENFKACCFKVWGSLEQHNDLPMLLVSEKGIPGFSPICKKSW